MGHCRIGNAVIDLPKPLAHSLNKSAQKSGISSVERFGVQSVGMQGGQVRKRL